MLSKEVCKKCRSNYGWFWKWHISDYGMWENEREVRCPHASLPVRVNIDEPVPSRCPYCLEHLMVC